MEAVSNWDDSKIYRTLLQGREADRAAAQAAIKDPAQKIDRAALRLKLIAGLFGEFKPQTDSDEDADAGRTRAYLLSTLAMISDGNAEADKVLRDHLKPEIEPNQWTRYWTFAALIQAQVPDLEALAGKTVLKDGEPLVHMLGVAVLASKGEADCYSEIKEKLSGQDSVQQWATLRALRILPLQATVPQICAIANADKDSDATYNAVIALGMVPSDWSKAEPAARTLADWLVKNRFTPMRDGTRAKALVALRNLKVESASAVVFDELLDDNPSIVREAARSAEKVFTNRTAVARVVEAAIKKEGQGYIQGLAYALRSMNYEGCVQELAALMDSGTADQQTYARLLLSELGGLAAMQKVVAQSRAANQYTSALQSAEDRIQTQFETSINEARGGYKLSSYMDLAVFILGLALIALSGGSVLLRGGTLDSWVGVGLTGGVGVLGLLYSLLIANPRRQVETAVDHLMYLKVVFLGYLRQLHQVDQSFTRYMLEDKPLTLDEVSRFTTMVNATMDSALGDLGVKLGEAKTSLVKGGAVTIAAAAPAVLANAAASTPSSTVVAVGDGENTTAVPVRADATTLHA
jgi:hypothetical protein